VENKSKSLDRKVDWEVLPVIGWIPYLRNLGNKHENLLDTMGDLGGYAIYQTIPTVVSTLVASGFYNASEIDQYFQILFPFTL